MCIFLYIAIFHSLSDIAWLTILSEAHLFQKYMKIDTFERYDWFYLHFPVKSMVDGPMNGLF